MTALRNLLRNECGTSVVELGLIAPILAALVIGMIDLAKGFNHKLVLEQVAQRGIEKAMQGVQGDNQAAIFQTLKVEVAQEAGVSVNNVNIRYWLECAGVSQNSNSATMVVDYGKQCDEGVQYSRFLEVSITKAYTPTFNMPYLQADAQGKVQVKARAGIRVQ